MLSLPPGLLDTALMVLLLILPLHTLGLLLLDRAGVRGTPFHFAQAWKEMAGAALLAGALAGAVSRHRAGARFFARPADRLAVTCACLLAILALLPYRQASFGQRMAGLRVNGLFLVFYGIGRLLPNSARIRGRLSGIALGVAGVLGGVGVVEWFVSPLGTLRRVDYGGFVARAFTSPPASVESIPGSYFTTLGMRRSGSLVLDPLTLGQICVVGAGAALAVHMIRRGMEGRAAGVLAVCVLGMVAARSRTAIAAFVAVACLGTLYAVTVRWGRRTVPLLAAASIGLALVAVVAAPRLGSARQDPERPSTPAGAAAEAPPPPSGAHPSLQAHIEGLESAWSSLRRHPWGTGLGSNALATLRLSGPLARENQFLLIAVEGGWLLLAAVVLFLGTLAGGLARQTPDHRMASATGLMFILAALTCALTAQIFLNFELVALAFLAAGAGMPPLVGEAGGPPEPAVLVPSRA